MTMEELFTAIENVTRNSTEVNWLIIHAVADEFPESAPGRFSFVDKQQVMSEPFGFRQGYLSLEQAELEPFKALLVRLIDKYDDNPAILANLFILQSRVSMAQADSEALRDFFKSAVGTARIPFLYDTLIRSLNNKFFGHTSIDQQPVADAKDWHRLFVGSARAGRAHEVLLSVVLLVSDNIPLGVDFRFVRPMKPMIRASLCGFWAMGILMDREDVKSLVEESKELPFLTTFLINRSKSRFPMADWITIDLIRSFFADWKRTGSFFLEQVFGGYWRRTIEQDGIKQLETLTRAVVAELIVHDGSVTARWIECLGFPGDFLGLFASIGKGQLAYHDIPFVNKGRILKKALQDLDAVFKHLEVYVGENLDKSGPSKWFLSDVNFQNCLSFLLCLYLEVSDEDSQKRFKHLCFETKLLYYGAYETTSLARRLAEMILLTCLSGDSIRNMTDIMLENLEKLQAVVVETMLVPYVHTTEREEEIWNPEFEGVPGLLRSEYLLVNDALDRIKRNVDILGLYKTLLLAIDEIAIARWPFMDGRSVPARMTMKGGDVRVGIGE
jgi:hypothetical protein